ncbi:MAG: hypothetical protein AAGF12_18530 [Myxococcota bacterium]
MSVCARCESPLASEDLRCAVCGLPVPPDERYRGKVVAKVLRCDECGAALTYQVEVQAPKCAFCGSVAHVELSEDPIEEAELFLPFVVDRATAQSALRQWLGSLGWFHPSDLKSAATLASLTPLWWVAWTFDVDALVSWTADSDAGARTSSWAPHAGQSPISLRQTLVSASRGLTEKEVQKLTPHFDMASALRKPPPTPGAAMERFDVQRSAARQTIARAVEGVARNHASHWIPGSTYRNLHVAVMPKRLVTRRYALPTYVLAYRYKDTLYRAVVHGQNANLVLGKAPMSIAKIALVVGLVFAAIALAIVVLGLVAAVQ